MVGASPPLRRRLAEGGAPKTMTNCKNPIPMDNLVTNGLHCWWPRTHRMGKGFGASESGGNVGTKIVASRGGSAVGSLIAAILLSFVLMNVGAAGAGAATASAPGVTSTAIKVGIMSDITGPAASTFEDAPAAMEARFKQQNAEGGVDGRKITWAVADTTSSPAGAETAAKDLVQTQNVFLVTPDTALLFGGAPYLNQAGVPVLGYPVDGPEWYEQPNTNMFAFSGDASATEPAYTYAGAFYKSIGAKKISFIASNTPSSTRGITATLTCRQGGRLDHL